ncbi:MAG: hypothetical protein BYD32DRAFT_427392 [Podila humilis]|nr:MAG: hypothetical protein BYD32DRAFT_427392 [Podila humilis]
MSTTTLLPSTPTMAILATMATMATTMKTTMVPTRFFASAVVGSRTAASSHRASTTFLQLIQLRGDIVSFAHILGNVPSRCVLALALLLAPDGLVGCFARPINTWTSFRRENKTKE